MFPRPQQGPSLVTDASLSLTLSLPRKYESRVIVSYPHAILDPYMHAAARHSMITRDQATAPFIPHWILSAVDDG